MKRSIQIFNTLGFSLLLFIILLYACEEKQQSIKPFYEEEAGSISEYISTRKDSFSRFNSLMERGELDITLKAYNPHGNGYTVFLPVDKAFDSFISDHENYNTFQDLLDDQNYLKQLIRYHVVSRALEEKDFPFGALPDTTLSGDILTIGFSGNVDSTIQKVNNSASIIQSDIERSNGYVHIIDQVLNPVTFSSYEWLQTKSEYSIFTAALGFTGLKDTFKLEGSGNELIYPGLTLLVESDEVFNEAGIHSIDDLKNEYSPDNQNYTSYSNGLYQFVAYHILEGKLFLNNLEGKNTNYNTFARFPLSVNATGIDFKINTGVEDFDTLITGNDTTIVDYIKLKYDLSNVTAKNGAIHFIENVMEVYKPNPSEQTFQFYEEPLINEASNRPDEYTFEDSSQFEVIKWQGVKEIIYVNSPTAISGVMNNDYIQLEGDFSISYEIPKILPGKYRLRIKTNDDFKKNATIQVYLDGAKMGSNLDLSDGDGFNWYDVGLVDFLNYEQHNIQIEALISGRFTWDAVQFVPENY
jgi:uncharacterized surface protein with fasciclin (FAS1) repeats